MAKVRPYAGSMRAEDLRFTDLAYSSGKKPFIVSVARKFVELISSAEPLYQIQVDDDFRYDETDTKIGGYQDYTIYCRKVTFVQGGFALFVNEEESMGYNPDESGVFLSGRGFPDGVHAAAFVGLEDGIGILDWKGIDLEPHLDRSFPPS